MIAQAKGRTTEQLAVGAREIYVAYSDGMANSRLRIPGAESGTARNINTIAKLAAMAAALTAPGESQGPDGIAVDYKKFNRTATR